MSLRLSKTEMLALVNCQSRMNEVAADNAEVVKEINDRLKINLADYTIVAGGFLNKRPLPQLGTPPPEKPQNDIPAKTPR